MTTPSEQPQPSPHFRDVGGAPALETHDLFGEIFSSALRDFARNPHLAIGQSPDPFAQEARFLDSLSLVLDPKTHTNLMAAIMRAYPLTRNEPEYLQLIRNLWQAYREGNLNHPRDELAQIADKLGKDPALLWDVARWVARYGEISRAEWRHTALTRTAGFFGWLGCTFAVMTEGPLSTPGMRETYGGAPAMVALFLGFSLAVWSTHHRAVKTRTDEKLEWLLLAVTGLGIIVSNEPARCTPAWAKTPPLLGDLPPLSYFS